MCNSTSNTKANVKRKTILTMKLYLYFPAAKWPQDLGTTLLPTEGSIVQDSATTGHPRALNQRLLPVFLSLNTLPREWRQNLRMIDPFHPPHHSLNRKNIGWETTYTPPCVCMPHAHPPCVAMLIFDNFLFLFIFIIICYFGYYYFYFYYFLFLLLFIYLLFYYDLFIIIHYLLLLLIILYYFY